MKKKETRILKKLFYFIVFSLIALATIVAVLFSIYRNEISERVLENTNNLIPGKIEFKNLSISPFKQFPDLSISLNNVALYESKDSISDKNPIARLANIYVSFDLQNLLDRKITINKILLNKGSFNIIRNIDSTLNLNNGIIYTKNNLPENDSILSIKNAQKKSTKQKNNKKIIKKDGSALFNMIAIDDIQIYYKDKLSNKSSSFFINKSQSSFKWKKDSISLDLALEGTFIDFGIGQSINIKDQDIRFNTAVTILTKDSVFIFEKSNIGIEHSILHAFGGIDYKNNKLMAEINLSSNDINLNVINLFNTSPEQYEIDSGTVHFEAKVKGNLLHQVPHISANYLVNNMSIHFKDINKKITNINIKGDFDSGNKANFSEAMVSFDTISALVPNGYLKGKIKASNLTHPMLDYNMNAKIDLKELDSFIKDSIFSNLNGNIIIQSEYKGYFNPSEEANNRENTYTNIIFDNISMDIINQPNIRHLSGNIYGNSDTVCLSNMYGLIGNSDVAINGQIFNLKSFLTKDNNPIRSNFSIFSNRLDLANLLQSKENIGEGFAYQIKHIAIDVNASTTINELTNSPSVPIIHFNINDLQACIENMLPPIHIKQGLFVLGNKDSALYLDFQDFDIDILDGNIKTDFVFASPNNEDSYLAIDGSINKINIGKIFQKDTLPISKFMNADLYGEIKSTLNLSDQFNVTFNQTTAWSNNLTYKGLSDTVKLTNLKLSADTIQWNLNENKNPLVSLKTNASISAGIFATKGVNLNKLSYSVKANEGNFDITTGHTQWLKGDGHGKYNISPFSEPAKFHIEYDIEGFESEQLLKSFLEDTLMTGNLNLDFKLDFEGLDKNTILNSLNGALNLNGKDLTYHGIDIDELIEKLKRSQKFNLVDVGAMLVAGPVGLAVTKGSDYSRLLLNNGDATQITELITKWKITDGRFTAEDIGLSTTKNRCAAKGWISPIADSIFLDIAVLNPTGCSIMSQNIKGTIKDPKISELKVINSLIAPVTNLFEDVFSSDCDIFYEGEVKHPTANKK